MTTIEQQGLGMAITRQQGELAVASVAAKAKALVEAKYVIALRKPRNMMQARATILDACKRPEFAEIAWYAKPVGGTTVSGPSIRFAEVAIAAMTNIDCSCTTVWEDDEKVIKHIEVLDLENNTSYSDDATIRKVVERRNPKPGQEVLSERINSRGDKVFLVAATEDDLNNKINAAKSKVIRNNGLRLVPQDFIEEAEKAIANTISRGGGDPAAEIKKICDAFGQIRVKPADIEQLLGHQLETISPQELVRLRRIYAAVKDGEASWSDYVNEKNEGRFEPKKAGRAEKTVTGAATKPQPNPDEQAEADAGMAPTTEPAQSDPPAELAKTKAGVPVDPECAKAAETIRAKLPEFGMTEAQFVAGAVAKKKLPPATTLDDMLKTSPRQVLQFARGGNLKTWVTIIKDQQ